MDRLLSVEAIYYMADPLRALQEWHRVTRPNGSLWIMVDFYLENPYCQSWADLMEIPMHLYSESEYARLLRKAGFADIRTERLYNIAPLDDEYQKSFQPGWGFETLGDVIDFRTRVGSLLISGKKPD
jgi:ubiquinone/menaquinone biosynthesis C-methylase UbiE